MRKQSTFETGITGIITKEGTGRLTFGKANQTATATLRTRHRYRTLELLPRTRQHQMVAKPQVLRPAEPTVIPVARAAQDPIRAAGRVMQTVVAQARAPPRRMVRRQRPRPA